MTTSPTRDAARTAEQAAAAARTEVERIRFTLTQALEAQRDAERAEMDAWAAVTIEENGPDFAPCWDAGYHRMTQRHAGPQCPVGEGETQ